MANQQKYFIGPSLLSDIRSTIQRVDAIAPRTSGPAQEVRLQGLQQPMDGGGRLRVGKVSDEWSIDTCADVTIWSDGGVVCEPAEMWPTEVVEGVLNVSHNVRAGSWVVIGKTTQERWVLVDSGHSDSCRQTISGEDITKWPGWNGSIVQLLGHDENGCLKWFDSEECEEPSPGTP